MYNLEFTIRDNYELIADITIHWFIFFILLIGIYKNNINI